MSDAKKAALAKAKAKASVAGLGTVFGVPVAFLFVGAAVLMVVAVVRRRSQP